MKKIIITGIISLVFLSSIIITTDVNKGRDPSESTSKANVLYVGGGGPGNYSTIQEAIDDAMHGDYIYVFSGLYHENVELHKRVTLTGEHENTTCINGSQQGCTITVTSENAVIEHFTIVGGGFDTDDFTNFFRAGIRITGSNTTIRHNIFRENCLGISGVRVSNLTITNNIFMEDGIGFTAYENDGRPELKREYFIHTIQNNTVNGKPFYYLVNQQDLVIESCDIGQLLLVNCSNCSIKNISISNTDWGLVFAFCNHCLMEHCSVCNNSLALWTLASNNNIFQFNTISNNYHRGIVIDYNSNRNKVLFNSVSSTFCGVEIEWWSNANLIAKNNFKSNNVSGYEHQSLLSMWFHNYYDDWKGFENPLYFFFPKVIYGMPIEQIPQFVKVVSIDFFPAKQPYDLEL